MRKNITEKDLVSEIEKLDQELNEFIREIDKDEINETETEEIEKQIIDDDDEFENLDIVKMYLDEIGRIPDLSAQEKLELPPRLKETESTKLLLFKKEGQPNLNTDLFFKSMINLKSSIEAIDYLLAYYAEARNSVNDKIEDALLECKKMIMELNRPLNEKEMKKFIGQDAEEILEEKDLLKQVKDFVIYKRSFDRIYQGNLKLVVSEAKKYASHVSFSDLISEGNIGLIKAVRKYDFTRGFEFSTYATLWIRQGIRKLFHEQSSLIKIPVNEKLKINKFMRQVEELEIKYCRQLTDKEISQELSLPIATVKDYREIAVKMKTTSLDQKVGDSEDTTTLDFVAGEANTEEESTNKSLKQDINVVFDILSEREKEVVKMAFGFDDGRRKEPEEIATIMNLKPSKVETILHAAIRKMRFLAENNPKVKSLKEYM